MDAGARQGGEERALRVEGEALEGAGPEWAQYRFNRHEGSRGYAIPDLVPVVLPIGGKPTTIWRELKDACGLSVGVTDRMEQPDDCASQRHIAPSTNPDAIVVPSGDHAPVETQSACPRRQVGS